MTTEFETQRTDARGRLDLYGPLALLAVILCMVAAHLSLLNVPYFWDETYFAPAARDLFQTGKLVPVSVPVESHPPLVYLWLAIWWKLFGFSIVVARSAMLAVAALTLAAVYRLARLFTAGAVPIVVTALTAIYPVFFAVSTLVQLDMAAAGLTLWGVVAFLQERRWKSGVLFTLAVLAKETAIVAPLVISALELLLFIFDRKPTVRVAIRSAIRSAAPLFLPLLVLVCWFAWLHQASGSAFGDPGYVKYNVHGGLSPARFVLAGAQHLWHLFIYLNLFVLTGFAALIYATRPRILSDAAGRENTRGWLVLAALTAGYLAMLSVVGAVTLARYLLPVYPIVILASVAAINSRVRWWPVIAGLTAVAFFAGMFPYTNRFLFRRDENLAYLDFARLHQAAVESFANSPKPKVMSVWPGSSELSEPWLGYAKQPLEILEVNSFTRQDLIAARHLAPQYILMFPRGACKTENPFRRDHGPQGDYFHGTQELSPDDVAALLNARVIYRAHRRCDWVAVLKLEDTATTPQAQTVAH